MPIWDTKTHVMVSIIDDIDGFSHGAILKYFHRLQGKADIIMSDDFALYFISTLYFPLYKLAQG